MKKPTLPELLKTNTYIGAIGYGEPAILALMIVLSCAYFTFGNLPFVKALFAGLGALVVVLLVNAILVLGKSVFKKISFKDWKGFVISLAAFVWMALVGAIFKYFQGVVNIPVAVTLGIGALVGAIYGAKLVAKFKPNALKALFGLLFLYVSLKYILIYF